MTIAPSTNEDRSPSFYCIQLQMAIRARRPPAGVLSTLIARASRLLAQLNLTALSAELKEIAVSLSTRVTDQTWVINVSSPALIISASARASSRRQIPTTALVHERRYSVCIGESNVRNRSNEMVKRPNRLGPSTVDAIDCFDRSDACAPIRRGNNESEMQEAFALRGFAVASSCRLPMLSPRDQGLSETSETTISA
jgi:hypothetical protein